jgi:hypothetical protein
MTDDPQPSASPQVLAVDNEPRPLPVRYLDAEDKEAASAPLECVVYRAPRTFTRPFEPGGQPWPNAQMSWDQGGPTALALRPVRA